MSATFEIAIASVCLLAFWLLCRQWDKGGRLYCRGKAYYDGRHFRLKEGYKRLPWWKKMITYNYHGD
jgi:hypothetical protein